MAWFGSAHMRGMSKRRSKARSCPGEGVGGKAERVLRLRDNSSDPELIGN